MLCDSSVADYLSPLIVPANLCDLMESSDVVGNIRFSHPTLYVFPGGQGDAALFGINGFNMLGNSHAQLKFYLHFGKTLITNSFKMFQSMAVLIENHVFGISHGIWIVWMQS